MAMSWKNIWKNQMIRKKDKNLFGCFERGRLEYMKFNKIMKGLQKLISESRYRQFKSNKPILVLMALFTLAFFVLCFHLFYFMSNESYEVISSNYNPRQAILAKQNIRGNIENEEGIVLATTYVSGEQEQRVYPYENLFAHVVGYSDFGTTGIENIKNMTLVSSSVPLSEKVVNDLNNKKDKGDTVVCTLDVDLQQTAHKALGVYKGAVVVTDVKTGKVLTMVSKPDFDPNTIAKEWENITNDPDNSVLVNRATQGLYPPGSTFKILDLLEFYRENPTDYDKFAYTCTGRFQYADRKISCYHGMKHGSLDLRKAFAKSCNCSFANIGVSLNRESFRSTLDSLLFDQELPMPLAYSKSHVNFGEETEDSIILQATIGQGESVITPMHLNMITAAIANKGILMEPLFVTEVKSAEGTTISTYKPKEYKALMTEAEAEILKYYMQAVVEEGTGDFLKGAGYTSAGKTGSAEYGSVKGKSHAWFTGFMPAEEPQIAVTVIIEGAGSGGDYAVPIAKRIFDCYYEKYMISQ